MSRNQWFAAFFIVILILSGVLLARFFNQAIVIPTIIIAMIIVGIFSYLTKKRNTSEMREKIMPEIASKFGKIIFADDDALGFEYNGTLFEAKILWISMAETEETEFIIRSNLKMVNIIFRGE